MCDPEDHTRGQQSVQSAGYMLNSEDEEGRDNLDLEAFSDVCLFLSFYLKSKDRIA